MALSWKRHGTHGLALAVGCLAVACHFDASSTPFAEGLSNTPDAAPAPPADAPSDGNPGGGPLDCPTGFASVAGAPATSKYLLMDEVATWSEARSDCAGHAEDEAVARTHLVALETAEEYAAIVGLVGDDDQQLGLTRLPGLPWGWVTGVVANIDHLPWMAGEPGSAKYCAAIVEVDGPQGSGDVMRVRTAHCISYSLRRYVCECEDGVGDVLFN